MVGDREYITPKLKQSKERLLGMIIRKGERYVCIKLINNYVHVHVYHVCLPDG